MDQCWGEVSCRRKVALAPESSTPFERYLAVSVCVSHGRDGHRTAVTVACLLSDDSAAGLC